MTAKLNDQQKKELVDEATGEIIPDAQLNQVIHVHTVRPDGTTRVQWDYKYCPTMAEQHTAHLTNLNYLMKRFKPDELAAYITARGSQKTEIIGHDFSKEPNLQDARNVIYQLKKGFEALPEEVKMHFRSHVEFLKFIDNPANADKMLKLGIMTKQQVLANQTPTLIPPQPTTEKTPAPQTPS